MLETVILFLLDIMIYFGLIVLNCICIKHLHIDLNFLKNNFLVMLWFVLIPWIQRYLKNDQTMMGHYRDDVEFHLEEYSRDKNQSKYLNLPSVIPYPHPSPILHAMDNIQLRKFYHPQ